MDTEGLLQNELHKTALNSLCRLCGQIDAISKKHRKTHNLPKRCDEWGPTIMKVYQIDVSKDSPQTHPEKMCHKCHIRLYNVSKQIAGISADVVGHALFINNMWIHHSLEHTCEVCAHRKQLSRGGRILNRRKLNFF